LFHTTFTATEMADIDGADSLGLVGCFL
jgi:hypothetical protein